MKDYDILIENRGRLQDVAVKNGDLALGDTLRQNVGTKKAGGFLSRAPGGPRTPGLRRGLGVRYLGNGTALT